MKGFTISNNIVIVIFLTFTLFGCSSDDDNILGQNDYSNKIDFDGKTYQVSGGNFENFNNYEFSMALFPIGITFNDSQNVINGGDWYLEIELTTDDNTIEGTYKSGEDVFGYFINNANFVNDELQPGYKVHDVNQNGTLKINRIGSEYEFIYNAFDDKGVDFSVYYKGTLKLL